MDIYGCLNITLLYIIHIHRYVSKSISANIRISTSKGMSMGISSSRSKSA